MSVSGKRLKKIPMGVMRRAAAQQVLKTPLLFHALPVDRCLQACRFAAEGVRCGTVFKNHESNASACRAGSQTMSFGCASGDISDLLDAGFHSVDAARRFGTSNFAGFSDPSLDEAIEKSAQIPNSSERRVALQAIVRRVTSEHLLVPLEGLWRRTRDAWGPA